MGLTPVRALKLSVSSESMPVPEGQPATVRRPRSSGKGLMTTGPSGRSDDDEFAGGGEAVDDPLESLGAGDGGEDDVGSADFLQFLGWVLRGGVDVDVRAELFGERALILPASDGDGAIAGLGCVLDGEVAEAADAEDGNGVAGARSAIAQGVEGGDTGAKQRCRIGIVQVVGDDGDGVGGGDDVVGIAAVVVDAADGLVFAEDEVAATAGRAVVAVAAVPAESDALADFEDGDVGADGVEDTGDFVAGDAGELDAGPHAFFGERVAVADAAGLHADADLAGAGIGKLLW